MRWVKPTTARARQLRRTKTSPEQTLWYWLRAGRMQGLKFRRQHPVPPYFLDFACASIGLAIELDGAGHSGEQEYDSRRDAFLRDLDWTVLRFGNDDVVLRLHAVLETIVREIEKRVSPLPDPLPLRGRGRRW
jgi:very-short-patch-repair endonuclease